MRTELERLERIVYGEAEKAAGIPADSLLDN